jgi:hypothetical protein
MDVCVRLFCVCVVLCVGSGLATGCSPVQGILPTVYRITKLKSGQIPTKGCRAIDDDDDDKVVFIDGHIYIVTYTAGCKACEWTRFCFSAAHNLTWPLSASPNSFVWARILVTFVQTSRRSWPERQQCQSRWWPLIGVHKPARISTRPALGHAVQGFNMAFWELSLLSRLMSMWHGSETVSIKCPLEFQSILLLSFRKGLQARLCLNFPFPSLYNIYRRAQNVYTLQHTKYLRLNFENIRRQPL